MICTGPAKCMAYAAFMWSGPWTFHLVAFLNHSGLNLQSSMIKEKKGIKAALPSLNKKYFYSMVPVSSEALGVACQTQSLKATLSRSSLIVQNNMVLSILANRNIPEMFAGPEDFRESTSRIGTSFARENFLEYSCCIAKKCSW